jgi:plasmid stabilization system protein ParE
MASLPKPVIREFIEVQRDLDATVSHLHRTLNPKARARLLRELRALLEEADVIIESGKQADVRLD